MKRKKKTKTVKIKNRRGIGKQMTNLLKTNQNSQFDFLLSMTQFTCVVCVVV